MKVDSTPNDWVIFTFDAQSNQLVVDGTGSGGHAELMDAFQEDKCQFALLRLIEQETNRVKFVMITWVGSDVKQVVQARSNGKRAEASKAIGAINVEIRALRSRENLDLDYIWTQIKAKVDF